ncbi:MAG: hypothetical protein IK999_05310 [Ruminococcus sp.]|nr:hypothetical protein [Ruminococcus sp.]
MTDKELDEKLRLTFDEMRTNNAVKARISERIMGDNMDVERIIMDNENENETNKPKRIIKITNGGKAAVAAAAVLVIGGGLIFFNNKAPEIKDNGGANNAVVTTDDEDIVTNKVYYDESGKTMFDKFGKESDIWELENGRYLIRQTEDKSDMFAEEDMDFINGLINANHATYIIYDAQEKNIVSQLRTDKIAVKVYDDCFILWRPEKKNSNAEKMEDKALNTQIAKGFTGQMFDFDFEPVGDEIKVKAPDKMSMIIDDIPDVDTAGSVYYRAYNLLSENSGGIMSLAGSKLYKDDEVIFGEDSTNVLVRADITSDRKYLSVSTFGAVSEGTQLFGKCTWYELPYDGNAALEITSDGPYTQSFVLDDKFCSISVEEENVNLNIYNNESKERTVALDVLKSEYLPMSGFVTEDGKYLVQSYRKINNAANPIPEGGLIKVYDIENDFKPLCEHESDIVVMNIWDGCDLLFDEESGEIVCKGYIFKDNTQLPETKIENFNINGGTDEVKAEDEDISANDPAKVIEKFGANSEISILSNGNYLVKQVSEDGISVEYTIYDAENDKENSWVDKADKVEILDNGFAIYRNMGDGHVQAMVYGNDGIQGEVRQFSFTSDKASASVQAVTFNHDGSLMYVAVEERDSDNESFVRIYSVNESGTQTYLGKMQENISVTKMSVTADDSLIGVIWNSTKGDDRGENNYSLLIAENGETVETLKKGHQLYSRGNKLFLCNNDGISVYCAGSDEEKALFLEEGVESGSLYVGRDYPDDTFADGYPNYFVTESGEYVIAVDKSDRASNTVKVSKMGLDDLEELFEEKVDGKSIVIYDNGANLFFDEKSGDLCAGAWDLDGNGGYSAYKAKVF